MVDGSTSIAPLMEVIAEEYMQQNPEAKIVIEESDSSKEIDSVIKRNAEIAMSSRELKDYEKELLDYETIGRYFSSNSTLPTIWICRFAFFGDNSSKADHL